MSGDRFDYKTERARHERFVGRAALLFRLDQLLLDDEDRWVVITGGPGMGKSALLAAWLARRAVAGAVVPHHFIRRGLYDWDDPGRLIGSLVAQLEDGFPAFREPEEEARLHPAMRLGRALAWVSEHVLAASGERLVVVIDGLDEYDPPSERGSGDPLAAFLPHSLPTGVRLLCASRPRHPYVSSLDARDGELVQLDLDDPSHAADNDATVRAFWESVAAPLGVNARFVDTAVARAGGNVQHAVQLRKRLAVLPPAQREVEDIPRGLAALIEKAWVRVAVDPVVVDGLGILCAAHEALTLDEIAVVAGWNGSQRQTFVRAAKELLVAAARSGGQLEYRLHHDAIRGYIAQTIGDTALRAHHGALAQRYATWPASGSEAVRRYALRHALSHRAETGEWTEVWRLASDTSFLEAKCRALGAHDAEADVTRIAERCRTGGDATIARRLRDLAQALRRDSHWFRIAPEATAALVWNQLRRLGWSAGEIDEHLRTSHDATFLRVRHVVTRESPALVRDLVGHTKAATACAVTSDGRRVVSASDDATLIVWDIETGRPLTTLKGHARRIWACAITPDDRRVVSASDDHKLKVWDLETGRMLATLDSHRGWVNTCAVTPDGQRVISGSDDQTLKIWDLESFRLLATLDAQAVVMACAVTPDGRRVISALSDKTLKVWDLESFQLLATLTGHRKYVTACTVTPDGQRVVSASDDRTLKVWDLETGQPLVSWIGHTASVTACVVTPDGQWVVSASNDKTLKVWDLETGRLITTLEGHAEEVTACAVTPDGRRVVSASWDTDLKIWDLEAEPISVAPEGHTAWVVACTVTLDGRCVISASEDRTLRIWDAETGRSLAILEGHFNRVTACAVTPDGRRMVSAAWDKTLRVWDLATNRSMITLYGHAAG
jgi:WD40 repeat protein